MTEPVGDVVVEEARERTFRRAAVEATQRKPMTRSNGGITGLFGRRREPMDFVQTGAVYRRMRADRVVERAEVVDSYADAAGIPHVRYDVTLESTGGMCLHEGTRVLSLRAFSERFAEHAGEVVAQD